MMRVVDDGLFTTLLTNPVTGRDGFIVMGVARFCGHEKEGRKSSSNNNKVVRDNT